MQLRALRNWSRLKWTRGVSRSSQVAMASIRVNWKSAVHVCTAPMGPQRPARGWQVAMVVMHTGFRFWAAM